MSTEQSLRKFHPHERDLLSLMLGAQFPGRKEVAVQLDDCLVRDLEEIQVRKWGSVGLVPINPLPAAVVNDTPVEAEAVDLDGGKVAIRLHLVDGVVRELEIDKDNMGIPVTELDLSKIRIWINYDRPTIKPDSSQFFFQSDGNPATSS